MQCPVDIILNAPTPNGSNYIHPHIFQVHRKEIYLYWELNPKAKRSECYTLPPSQWYEARFSSQNGTVDNRVLECVRTFFANYSCSRIVNITYADDRLTSTTGSLQTMYQTSNCCLFPL